MNESLISVIIPARNEAASLAELLPALRRIQPQAEIIVVNDGSTDDTMRVCSTPGIEVINHPYSMGNGAAVKSGARAARGHVLVFMDGDGQHDPNDIPRLLEKLEEGYDMAVGARARGSQAGMYRALANNAYNKLASWMTGKMVDDLTSGFRAVRTEKFRKFLYLLPNGFSYPTTITMAFFRSAYPIAYVPIKAAKRTGASNISLLKDGVRFFLIILKIGALFSPMRLFLPVSLLFFLLGLSYYSYTFFMYGRLTTMSALLFTASMLTFLLGILSEQISALHYRRNNEGE